MPSLSGNSWAVSDKGKGGSTGGERPRSMQPMPVQGEQHVPVRDFNAAEVKDFLKKRMSQLSKFPVLVLCLLKKEVVEVTHDSASSSSTNNFSNYKLTLHSGYQEVIAGTII
jgi:hypothetical protein